MTDLTLRKTRGEGVAVFCPHRAQYVFIKAPTGLGAFVVEGEDYIFTHEGEPVPDSWLLEGVVEDAGLIEKATHMVGPLWYDTLEGLRHAHRRGLQGLNEILDARHEAGYQRHERMHEWVIGRFWLDTCGNAWTFDQPVRAHRSSPVALAEVREQTGGASLLPIAKATDKCPRCGQRWNLDNAHDVVRFDEQFFHHECKRYLLQEVSRQKLGEAVFAAGLDAATMVMIPNRYGPSEIFGPWFLVASPIGPITLGWRKRVIEISWQGGPDGNLLFGNESTTVEPDLVHAWGYDKATEYLRALVSGTPTTP